MKKTALLLRLPLAAFAMACASAGLSEPAGALPPRITWSLDDQMVEYAGDGKRSDFPVSFPHTRQRYITTWIRTPEGKELPLGKAPVDSHKSRWLGDAAIHIDPAPEAGTSVVIRGTNGIRMTTDTKVLHAFFVTGQSNAAGTNKDPEQHVVAAKPIYPGLALMPANGVRPDGAFSDFADLVESGPEHGAGLKETGASGLANHFIRDVDELFHFKPRVFCAVVAAGGQPLAKIGAGSPTSNALLDRLQDCVDAARRHGWRVIVPAIPFNQGEQDGFFKTSRSAYVRGLVEYQRYLETNIQRITGQTEPVVLVMTQTRSTGYGLRNEPPIILAQLDADGLPGIRLAGPKYQYGRSDSGHLDIMGQNRQGQAWERAILAECYGQGWSSLRPVSWNWAAPDKVDIKFHVPIGPLVLDTNGDVDVTSTSTVKGFVFRDEGSTSCSIRSVELLPNTEDTVRIELTGSSTGPRPWIGYAVSRETPGSPDGPVEGARGCLHDSTEHLSLYDGHNNPNWCAMFAIDLPPAPAAPHQ